MPTWFACTASKISANFSIIRIPRILRRTLQLHLTLECNWTCKKLRENQASTIFHEVILISAGRKSGGFTLSLSSSPKESLNFFPLFAPPSFFLRGKAENMKVINHGANWDLPACWRMSRLRSFRPKQVAQLFVSRRT